MTARGAVGAGLLMAAMMTPNLPAMAQPIIRVNASAGVSAKPLQHRYKVKLPELAQATPKAERTFDKIVRTIVQEQYALLVKWRNGVAVRSAECNSFTENSSFRAKTRKSLIDGRYATATILINTWPACGNVDQANARTINLDTRTGKSLTLDTLIDREATYPVVERHLSDGARTVIGTTCQAQMYKRRSLYNWSLKRNGIQFWFDKYAVSSGYCGAVSVTVPWRELPLKPQGERLAAEVR